MKHAWLRSTTVMLLVGLIFLLSYCRRKMKIVYPETKTTDQIDDYHGTRVTDPYRWLEDDASEETKAWVEAQNAVTFDYLERIPERRKIEKRLTELWNYERHGLPEKKNGKIFFTKNDGLQNQSVLCMRDSLEGDTRVLLDPNTFSEDGTVALVASDFSENARYLMYGTASGGSDWREFFLRDIRTGDDLEDHLRWIKFSGAAWSKDSKGFYYSRYPQPEEGKLLLQQNKNMKIYYHRVGTRQSLDKLIYEDPGHPDRMFFSQVSHDGRYLIITVMEGTDERNRVFYMRIGKNKTGRVIRLLNRFDAGYGYVDNDGSLFYFLTNLDAPNWRLVAIDIENPGRTAWRNIIPEGDDVLSSVRVVNDQLIAVTMHDAHHRIRIYQKDGNWVRDITLPALGTVEGISGDKYDREMFFGFNSFAYPATQFRYDFVSGETTAFAVPSVGFDPQAFETQQVFYPSKDGTRIPMFISFKKGIELNGMNPVYLTGYGGFNVSVTPYFSVMNLMWMEMGGVFALANLRGGGEYGTDWYKLGRLDKKQNVFDDFIAAAETLIAEGYTSKSKLAIGGASNGGLLVAACMVQRPDLFAAVLSDVGVLDMLRYHLFTIGWAWASDYGRSDDPGQFKTLFAYSPLHNLREGLAYPATLITTADHDDRVVPAHSFKFAATLQSVHAGESPVLIRVETRAGHGSGKPTQMQIEEVSDRLAFLVENLDMRY